MRPLVQRQGTLSLMAKVIARASCWFVSVPCAPQASWDNAKGPWWMPAHAVGHIMGEKHWVWAICCICNKPMLCRGAMLPPSSRLLVANKTLGNGWGKEQSRFIFLACLSETSRHAQGLWQIAFPNIELHYMSGNSPWPRSNITVQ